MNNPRHALHRGRATDTSPLSQMERVRAEHTEARKDTERRFSFAGFAFLVCFVLSKIPAPQAHTMRLNGESRGSNLQPGDYYGNVKKTLVTGIYLRQCLYGRRRAGGQRLAARHDHRFEWGGGGGRDRHYHGDAHEYRRDDRYQRRRELRLRQRQG